MTEAHDYADTLESELSKELENGRLFRLIVKLGFINEQPLGTPNLYDLNVSS
jgi:hypothetical protein